MHDYLRHIGVSVDHRWPAGNRADGQLDLALLVVRSKGPARNFRDQPDEDGSGGAESFQLDQFSTGVVHQVELRICNRPEPEPQHALEAVRPRNAGLGLHRQAHAPVGAVPQSVELAAFEVESVRRPAVVQNQLRRCPDLDQVLEVDRYPEPSLLSRA